MAKRNLYLTNLTVSDALKKYMDALNLSAPMPETVKVTESLDRVTNKAVYASCNSPLYDSAAMDGIAVISARTTAARETAPVELKMGDDYIVVDTGDYVRPPYDGVIMAEDLEESDTDAVTIRKAASPWQYVRPIGEDIVKGEMILATGHKIRAIDVGVLLSGGITEIEVRKNVSVAVIPTGTELVEAGAEYQDGDIIESNSHMLSGLVTQAGAAHERYRIIPDDYEQIKAALLKAAAEHDMVLINAGSSAGTEDYTVHILREIGEVIVHGAAIKPGKPVILAVVGGKPVIGIPGYPVSAYVAFQSFALPVLSALTGRRQEASEHIKAVLSRRLVSSVKHREYVRVKVGKVYDKYVASPLSRGAGAAMSLVRADGFCVIEQNCEGIEAGSEVDVELYTSARDLDKTVVSIGSHDLILDIIADLLPNMHEGVNLSSGHVGSTGGLLALKRGEAHIAPMHLLNAETGVYNISYIKDIFKTEKMALIKGVTRLQGIITQRGNPMNISGISDLPNCRYINRQRGAGTRVLLDYKLKQENISPDSINGYDREAATHMAVAAAVKNGSADAGMGVLSAANAMDLDFIYVGDEEYDFAIPQKFLDLPHIKCFLDVLKSDALKQKLDELGGYSADNIGEVKIIE